MGEYFVGVPLMRINWNLYLFFYKIKNKQVMTADELSVEVVADGSRQKSGGEAYWNFVG